jgi:hypothetical protein
MNVVDLFKFWIIDQVTGKRRLTHCLMTVDEAKQRFTDAKADPGSRETRKLPEANDND